MVPKLNVALVFNMKKRTNGGGVSETLSDRSDGENGDIAVSSRTKLQKTKVDTYAEWDSEETILAVKTALERHHRVTLIEADEEAYQKFLQVQPDIVFNIAEGLHGPSREAQIPALLELLDIPYTGSDPLPDTFRDNAQALADGRLGSDGVFRANKIQAKCASKYEAKPNQKGVSHPAQLPEKISSLR